MLRTIVNNPAAIGYVRQSQMDNSLLARSLEDAINERVLDLNAFFDSVKSPNDLILLSEPHISLSRFLLCLDAQVLENLNGKIGAGYLITDDQLFQNVFGQRLSIVNGVQSVNLNIN